MNRRTSGPLVASSMLLLAGSAATAQTFVAEDLCSNVSCIDIANDELTDVFGYEEEERADTGEIIFPGSLGRRLARPNLAVANVLSQLDIDNDGVPDLSADTDGDGLPDNWEVGGFEALTAGGEWLDRVVFYPAPSAIVPGTPPTPIFTRLAVGTSALDPDTDGDGLSDFVEVFGLKFIDEDGDGLLEANEWEDINQDGLPSPGEFPLDNSRGGGQPFSNPNLFHDFDGFVFTDPTNPDTDGDGVSDGEDMDPLINLRAFGNTGLVLVRFGAQDNPDIDVDGIGNAMDMGNDLMVEDADQPGDIPEDIQAIDNPANVGDLISLFRQDLEAAGVVPEAAIEDLLGADWDGNGLWRITDVRTWHLITDETDEPPATDFVLQGRLLYAEQSFGQIAALFNSNPDYDRYGGRGIGLGWQDLLRPTGRTQFLPDRRVWTILYSWRMPGFDIDGDGFIGVPNLASTAAASDDPAIASVALRNGNLSGLVPLGSTLLGDEPFDDRIAIGESEGGGTTDGDSELDGRVDPPPNFLMPCGPTSFIMLLAMVGGLAAMRLTAPRSPSE